MLDFSLSRQQQMVQKEVARLVREVVTDNAQSMDETGEIPPASLQKAWELGASLFAVPEEYGGYGMGDAPIDSAIILEALAYGDMAFAVAATVPSLFIGPVAAMGTARQKQTYLPLYCRETFTPCTLAVNEPRFGFDAGRLETTAQRRGGAFILNGEKCLVPLAARAGHLLVAALCDGHGGLFVVSADNPGLAVAKREKTLGLYALEMHRVVLEDCEVPAEDRLGGERGCDYRRLLERSRIAMAALAAGVAGAAYDFAREYAKTREQFGEPIAHRQAVAFMLAEMAYEVDAIRLMAWKAASRLAAGRDAWREAYLAKMYAGEMAMKIADYGVQILGGHGYIRDYPVERYYRNARAVSNLEALAMI